MLTLPSLRIAWGAYNKPEPEEEQQILATVRLALGGGPGGGEPLITKRVALEKIQPVFKFENIDALIEELDKETDERAQKSLEQKTNEATAMGEVAQKFPAKPAEPAKPGFVPK